MDGMFTKTFPLKKSIGKIYAERIFSFIESQNDIHKTHKKDKTSRICIGDMYDYKSYDQFILHQCRGIYVFFVFMRFGIMRFGPLPFRLYRPRHLRSE